MAGARSVVVASGEVQVVGEDHGRPRLVGLPGGREGHRPAVSTVYPPVLVGRFETTIAPTSHHQVLPDAENGEVDDAVGIDVERVRTGHAAHGQFRRLDRLEADPSYRGVAVEPRWVRPTSEVDVGEGVAVTVEDRHPAS